MQSEHVAFLDNSASDTPEPSDSFTADDNVSSDSEDDDDECDKHVDIPDYVKHAAFQQDNGTVGDNQPNTVEQASQSNNVSNLSEDETDCGGNKQRSNLQITTYRYVLYMTL